MSRPSLHHLIVVAVLASAALARPALADDKADAQALHKRGLGSYDAGNYEAAIEDYRAAYALFPVPGILFNLGHAYRLSGDCPQAKKAYEEFVREAGESRQAKVARRHLAELGDCPETAQPALVEAAAEKEVPAFTNPAPPVSAPDPALPGPSRPAPAIAIPPLRPSHADQELRLYGLLTGGLGVVIIGTGVVYGLDARAKSQQVEDFVSRGGQWSEALRNIEADGNASEDIAIAASVLGTAALIGGATLYWSASSGQERAAPVSLVSRGDDAMVTWSGAF